MRSLLRFSTKHPRMVVAIIGLVTILVCLFIPRVRLQLDGRSLIPVGDPRLTASDKATEFFGLRDVVVLGIINKRTGIYTSETLGRLARLSEGLKAVDGVIASSVTSLATIPRLFISDDKISTQPLLKPGVDLDAEMCERIKFETESLGINDGVLVTTDGTGAVIFADVTPSADREAILKQTRELVKKESGSDDAIHLSGTALAQATLGQSAARDLMRLIPAVILVVGFILMMAFRHLAPACISLAEIAISLLWTIGLIGFTDQSVFVTTLVMPVILMAVGVSDDVYALAHFFEEAQQAGDRPTAQVAVAAFSGVARSIMLTAISTVIGLVSLAVTGLEPLRVFGIFGAVAILFSTLFTFTLVPALLVLTNPKLSKKQVSRKAREVRGMLAIFNALCFAGPRRILALVILAAGIALLMTTQLRIDDSWVKNLPGASDVYRGDTELNNNFAGTITLDLMIDSGQAEGYLNPETIKMLGGVEDAIAALPTVGSVRSIYSDILRVNASLKGLNYADYREAVLKHRRELTRDEVEQALLLMASVRHTPISEQINRLYQIARVTVFIRSANYERIHDVLATASRSALKISSASNAVTPFGDGWISYLTVRLLVEGQVWSIALALLTDLALLSLLLGSLRTGLIAILPVAFSVLVVFAVLAATGTPLGIANSMFAGIAIGIGLDFSIHLTSRYRQEVRKGLAPGDSLKGALIGTGPAIITSAVAITAGFSVLALSEVAPNMQLGLMICLSLLVCAAATLVLVPSLVMARRTTR